MSFIYNLSCYHGSRLYIKNHSISVNQFIINTCVIIGMFQGSHGSRSELDSHSYLVTT